MVFLKDDYEFTWCLTGRLACMEKSGALHSCWLPPGYSFRVQLPPSFFYNYLTHGYLIRQIILSAFIGCLERFLYSSLWFTVVGDSTYIRKSAGVSSICIV